MSEINDFVLTVDEDALPAGWTLASIDDLIGESGVFVDGDWVESKDQDPNGDVRLIQLADIGDGGYRNKSERFLTSVKAKELGCTYLEKGDVLVARMPDPLGRACLFPGDSKRSVTVVDVAIVRPADDAADTRWLMYFINAPAFRNAVASMESGSTRKRISRRNLSKILFPVPPLNEQTRIVAEIEKQFSRLDEAVANLKRVKANLKRYKAAVLKAAVEGKLTEEWRRQHPEVEPADKLLERILAERRKAAGKGKYKEPVAPDASGLPELPVGWVWATGEQLFEWSSGDFLPASKALIGSVPVYGGNGISGYHDTSNVDCPTIIIGRVGAQCGNVHLSAGRTWVTDNAIYAKKLPVDVLLPYVELVLTVENLNKKAAGSGQPFVNQKMLNAILVPLPPLTEQHQIVAEVERRLSIVAGAEAQVDANLRRADRLRQSILKQAFSGQLVPQDPNDEPASVLLQRIRNAVGANHHSPRTAPKTPKRANVDSPLQRQTPRPSAESKPATVAGFACLDDITAVLLAVMQPGREYARADLADPLGLSTGQWNAAIQELKRRGQVRQTGEKRGARYELLKVEGGGT